MGWGVHSTKSFMDHELWTIWKYKNLNTKIYLTCLLRSVIPCWFGAGIFFVFSFFITFWLFVSLDFGIFLVFLKSYHTFSVYVLVDYFLFSNIFLRDSTTCPEYKDWKSAYFLGGYLPFESGDTLDCINPENCQWVLNQSSESTIISYNVVVMS